jgi:chemotaxis response regulator CheB
VIRKRILVVDDSELIRQQVRKISESDQQIEVCAEAQDGAEAVRMARQYRPDLVLMDVFMPEMSGLDALCEIRTEPRVPCGDARHGPRYGYARCWDSAEKPE